MVKGIKNIHLKYVDYAFKVIKAKKEKLERKLRIVMSWEEFILYSVEQLK